jgi:hypothetical protein
MPPTPIELALLAIIIPTVISGIAAYGKLRDEMATLRAEIVALKTEDTRNAEAIRHESRRNDGQDLSIGVIRETMTRIDTNVKSLLERDSRRAEGH